MDTKREGRNVTSDIGHGSFMGPFVSRVNNNKNNNKEKEFLLDDEL